MSQADGHDAIGNKLINFEMNDRHIVHFNSTRKQTRTRRPFFETKLNGTDPLIAETFYDFLFFSHLCSTAAALPHLGPV